MRAEFRTVKKHQVQVEFDEFGWSRLQAEADCQGTTVEALVVHAALYFLADLDEGRFSSRVLAEMADEPRAPDDGG
jgi:hypothetical protein